MSNSHHVVLGDGEGGIEMTESMQLIREFCDLFVMPQKATRTRIVRSKYYFEVEIIAWFYIS